MGTRSCIILKVRKEDVGKTLKFKESLLPVPLDKWQDKDHEGKVWRDDTGSNKCKPVEIKDVYIGIYCHWDGYPDGVGSSLLGNFKDYDSVLNLILGGSCSYIEHAKVRHYANRKGEKWGWILPKQCKTQKDIICHFVNGWAEYAYLFDEARGGWFYKEICGGGDSVCRRGFKVLK